jgi:alpha-beta hydrolase superfamily lysophospholipase
MKQSYVIPLMATHTPMSNGGATTKDDQTMSFLDHDLISSRYFFPRDGALPQTTWVESHGERLACYHLAPHPGARTLVHFHGNGEIVSDYIPDLTSALLDLGVNIFFAEYRGYGASTGIPRLASMLDDVDAICHATQCPPEQLVVFGRSIGSIYAIETAKRFPNIGGLILESGIADPFERVLLRVSPEELGISTEAFQAEATTHLDHQQKLSGYNGPLLILHTEHDGLVDRSHADRNFAWAASEQKTKHIFPRGNHNSIMAVNWFDYMDKIKSFLDTSLNR